MKHFPFHKYSINSLTVERPKPELKKLRFLPQLFYSFIFELNCIYTDCCSIINTFLLITLAAVSGIKDKSIASIRFNNIYVVNL